MMSAGQHAKRMVSLGSMVRQDRRSVERKDYEAREFVDDRMLESYPEHVFIDNIVHQVFDSQSEFVESFLDGELHALRVNVDKERCGEYGTPGFLYTMRVEHTIAAPEPDMMSTGELWREFWRRVRRKLRRFGLMWLVEDFLKELERMQGWR